MTSLPPIGLAALEARVARDLDLIAYPATPWVQPVCPPDVLDCAVIGAGQYGLCVAAGLKREKVEQVGLFDSAPAGREGPWATFARMTMLRTPKELTGPDLGVPALTFRAFWEAQYGPESWQAMYRVPRRAWMDYLNWFRRVMGLDVHNGWMLESLAPEGDLLRLGFATPEGPRSLRARTVVMATGTTGGGGYAMDPALVAAVPADRLHHANQVFDLACLSGARVGIQGAGAAAFDVAIAALGAGATSATVCIRRPAMPRDNPRRWMETAGHLAHYVDLPDAVKWATIRHLRRIGQPPPQPTWDAAMAEPGFALATGFPWEAVRWTGSEIEVSGGGQTRCFDQLVVATGFLSDLDRRPEYAALAPVVLRWADRFTPAAGEADERLGRQPYLDRFGAFLPRDGADWVGRVLTITGNASLSLGPVAASISAMKYVAPRLVEGVKRRLFLDQQAQDWEALMTRDHAELRLPPGG